MAEDVKKAMSSIAEYIAKAANEIDGEMTNRFLKLLTSALANKNKILVVGAGRSGLVARAFAMRLMHLGFDVYVVGETITPSVREGDILIAVSGSGSTQIVLSVASAAKKAKALVVAVTSFEDSPLGKLSDFIVKVPGRTKVATETDYFARQVMGLYEPLAPLGTLFEDTAMVFFDGVIYALMNLLGVREEDLKKRHANVEGL
ncbi:6-phospho-3-hexuloisomerase [Infirmifilum sp. NZ]|uniref:6-phospho-3-hexuloisomerase n=1 Tax=Infirmifilum sp. NZ TaxID=2926850 RepID=UPI0027AB6CED|nr:6-phospho-3-hexuloisomerase [Infirmifilum sp. NZ]UNQ72635.1 6-phospho-3-hexuloisomerase [Infirmifilum sp. NZ]